MPTRDIVVIGASAGGIDAFLELVRALPADLPASLFMVIHLAPDGVSALPRILNRAGTLPAEHAREGQRIQKGRIYVAPPDHHMVLRNGTVHLVHGPRENGSRPAVDPLFRSAARCYRNRVIGVVLSGVLDDGTQGLGMIKSTGGVTVAQDPEEALYSGMPKSAIQNVQVDHVLGVTKIAELIERLVHESVPQAAPIEDVEPSPQESEATTMKNEDDRSEEGVTGLTCPECGGALWQEAEEAKPRYHCRVGHAYSEGVLEAKQAEVVEAALWTAVRYLEEKAALMNRIAARAHNRRNRKAAERFKVEAEEARMRASVIREMLIKDTLQIPPNSKGVPGNAQEE